MVPETSKLFLQSLTALALAIGPGDFDTGDKTGLVGFILPKHFRKNLQFGPSKKINK